MLKPLALAIALLLPVAAFAKAPEPARPVDPSFFTGRWYEIVRTDHPRQRGCQAPVYQFEARNAGQARFTLICRRNSPTGPVVNTRANLRIPTDSQRNKFRVTAAVGLLGVDYWVLDVAPDTSWAILATPDGENVWLLARRASLDAALKARLLDRIRTLGFDTGRLIHPRHA